MAHRRRPAALAAALLSLAACRCGLLAPGLGYGVVDGPTTGARTEADALASLVVVGIEGQEPRTSPVVAVRGGRAIVLVVDAPELERTSKLTATFFTKGGTPRVVQGATPLVDAYESGRLSLVAFPLGDLDVHPVLVAPPGSPFKMAELQAIALLPDGTGARRRISGRGTLDPGDRFFDGAQESESGGYFALFDSSGWRLVGIGRSQGGKSVSGFGADWVLGRLSGVPRNVSVEVAAAPKGCRVTARLELDDAAGTFREVALVIGEPGASFAIPELPPRRRRLDEPVAPSPVFPISKKLAARAPVASPKQTVLEVELASCDEARLTQVLLVGDTRRWLSWPFHLPAAGARRTFVATGQQAWRVDTVPSGDPLEWKGAAPPGPPAATGEAGCLPPLGALDPAAIHVLVRPREPDPACSGAVRLFPAGQEELARCSEDAALTWIAEDGSAVYPAGDPREPNAWRRAAPDRNARGEDGACRLSEPMQNDEVYAAAVCGENPPEAIFSAKDGELVFACRDGLHRWRDGSVLDLRGGQLLRLGVGRSALVRLPWGSLGVLGSDGKGKEVGGLPLGARLDRPMPSTATPDGFLVAVETLPGASGAAEPQLFQIAADGKATSLGRFGPLDQDLTFRRYLTADGALLTIAEHERPSRSPIRRWVVGRGPELLHVPAATQEAWLLVGPQSSGPNVPGPVGRGPDQRRDVLEDTLAAYAAADPADLPCHGTLERLDPDRVYLRLDQRVLDLEDPARFTWLSVDGPVVSGDGRLLHAGQRPGGVLPVPDPAAALRPSLDGRRCNRFAGRVEASEPEPGGSCGVADQAGWAPIPGGPGVVSACREPGQDVVVGKVKLRGRDLVHAGTTGRLLLSTREAWTIVGPDGREAQVAGLPAAEKVRAIRAVPAGFVLAVDAAKARVKNVFDLMLVTDDGRARRLGGFEGIPEDVELQRAALDAKHALHALVIERKGAGRTVLFRIPLGGRTAEVVWEQTAYASQTNLLTGP